MNSNPSRYVVRNSFNQNTINNITIINNYNNSNSRQNYNSGPDYREVERYTHRTITPLAVTAALRPGAARVNRRQLQIYRPAVSANAANKPNIAPARVRSVNEVSRNANIRSSGVENNSNSGNSLNPANNTNTGNRLDMYRNRSFNNGNAVNTNPLNNTSENTHQGVGTLPPVRNERIESLRQNRQNNADQPQLPNSQLPANNQPPVAAPPTRRFQRPDQLNPGRPVTPAQTPENNPRFRNQRPENNRQLPTSSQGQPVIENRNIQRSQNIPERNSNTFRGQRNAPAAPTLPQPQQRIQRPARNMQQAPSQQNGPTERTNPRGRQRP